MNVLEFKKNTRNMFPEVVQYLAAIADEWETKYPHALHSRVWVLCTNEVWPADLSSCLWHFYGALVSEDLGAFRQNTRVLLHDFTAHWQRQAIVNPSMQEAAKMDIDSLADLVLLDRIDRVQADASGLFPVMASL
jgi:hypothetical protein